MGVGQDPGRDTATLATQLDSLRIQRLAGGTGPYTVRGDVYTEHTDYFFLREMVGRDRRATCHVEGDRWTHTLAVPGDTARWVEVWRRIE